jgi:hypothetical protein
VECAWDNQRQRNASKFVGLGLNNDLEEGPMDVHAPHGGIHTWKDFWIHLGTITIGLLIAIGLEQSVEWVHRLHEQHVLLDELREEGVENLSGVRVDVERLRFWRSGMAARRKDVQQMIASGDKLKLPYRVIPPRGAIALPSESTWDSAKASGKVALLPDYQSDVYSFLYLEDEMLKTQFDSIFALSSEKLVFERGFDAKFAETGEDGTPDLASMSVEQLKEYSGILDKNITQVDSMIEFLMFYDDVNRAVLDGAGSQEEVIRRVDEEENTRPGRSRF